MQCCLDRDWLGMTILHTNLFYSRNDDYLLDNFVGAMNIDAYVSAGNL